MLESSEGSGLSTREKGILIITVVIVIVILNGIQFFIIAIAIVIVMIFFFLFPPRIYLNIPTSTRATGYRVPLATIAVVAFTTLQTSIYSTEEKLLYRSTQIPLMGKPDATS